MIPNAPPFSPNYIHVADVARAHVPALRVCPLNPPQRPQARATRRGVRAMARGGRAALRGDARDPGAAPETGGRTRPTTGVCVIRDA